VAVGHRPGVAADVVRRTSGGGPLRPYEPGEPSIIVGDMATKYFLAKSEPAVYSIDDLERDGKTTWDGVKNPQAVQAIREMRPGDRVFIYHSGGASSVVGWAKVASEPRDDVRNPKSAVVDLEFGGRIEPPTTLAEVKQSKEFEDWALVRQSRLSTMAAPETFVKWMRSRHPKGKL
jgi:predicted RNA-binding protein with PUA-like domain